MLVIRHHHFDFNGLYHNFVVINFITIFRIFLSKRERTERIVAIKALSRPLHPVRL